LANKYPTRAQLGKEEFVSLRAIFCGNCMTVQLPRSSLVSRKKLFAHYYYLSSVNTALKQHFEQLARTIVERMKPDLVVDIGSNDGPLLRPLQESGVKAVGVEPAENIAKIANQSGLETFQAFFDRAVVEQIVGKYGRADVVVASNVFTHLDKIHQFTDNVKSLLKEGGVFIVEVEYLGDIIRGLQFERFYSDHTFYFTIASLDFLFRMHGMYVADAERIPTHGGSIRCYVRVGTPDPSSRSVGVSALLKGEQSVKLDVLDGYSKYAREVKRCSDEFKRELVKLRKKRKTVAAYGAPARLTTICNYLNIGPRLIKYVVEDSPLKQGRFTPGTHIPIVEPTYLERRPPDTLVVFAWNYFDEISRKTSRLHAQGMKYAIPIPYKVVS